MFRKQHQGMRVADDDLFPLGFNPSFFLPGAEKTAYGVNGGSGVVGQFLAAERKVDVNAVLRLAAGLLHDAQQRAGNALFHLFSADFQIAVLQLIEAIDGAPEHVHCQRRIRQHELRHGLFVPSNGFGSADGFCCCRIFPALEYGNDGGCFSGTDIPKDGLFSLFMELEEFDAAAQDKKAFMSRITLVKQDFPGLEADKVSAIQNIGCLRLRDAG